MDTKAYASSSSLSSSSPRHASPIAGMSTPKTARPRIPLGELPISSFLSAANATASASPSSTTGVSPILKPVATRHFADSPTRVKRSTDTAISTPHTPPHHETHPVNVRPHHPHVATGLGLGMDSPGHSRPAALPTSPTTCVAPATPPPSLLKRHHQSTSSSSPAPVAQPTATSSASPQQSGSNPTQSIPRRKRDRIDDAAEHVLARERGQDPVWTSPSPHKNAAIAAAAATGTTSATSRRYSAHAHHNHRRMSSTGSAKAFALSPRFAATKSLAPHGAVGSALDDANEDEVEDEEDELRDAGEMVAVKPLRINSPPGSMAPPSSKSATPPGSAAAAAPALGEDVFGVTTSSPSGGLVVFCDEETSAFPTTASLGPDRYASDDGANRENDVSLLEKFLGSGRDDETATGVLKKNKNGKGKSKSKSPSLSMGSSSSPGPSALSPMKRKKGTGGRLSLVATGEAGQAGGEEGEDDGGEDDDEEGEESG